MKHRYIKITAVLLVILLALSACGKGKTIIQDNSGEPGKGNTSVTDNSGSAGVSTLPGKVEDKDDGLKIAKSEDPFSFCVKYAEDYSYIWDEECGITIYTGPKGSIPYVLVWRSFDDTSTAEDLLDGDKSSLYYQYGDSVLAATEPASYSLGGKNLTGAEFQYMVGDNKVTMLRLVDESPATGYVLFTAKYLDASKADTMEALELAISSYVGNRNAYEQAAGAEDLYEIVPSISKTISFETYYDGYFKIDVPKGWVVEANSPDGTAGGFGIHVYDPANMNRQVYTAMQTLWFEDEAARKKLSSYVLAGSYFAGFPYLLGGSDPIAEMFQSFDSFKSSYYGEGSYLEFPDMNNWTKIENFGTTPLGGELIRATYTDNNGTEIEGVFSGKYVKGITMYGYRYPGAVYSPMFYTAPADEFNEMAEILNHIYCSLEYTENYIDQYYAEEKATMRAFEANTRIYNEMSDMITSSWEARQTTYDTISAKQSDATLGYDRVYNTETGEVYRVTTGFMDSYSGTLYKEIDDSMYSLPITGYIYK